MDRAERFFFAWEGSTSWTELVVVEARGREEISAAYEYTIDLALAEGAPDIPHENLLGARATLRIMTEVDPAVRLVHGVISEVEEIGVERGGRLRVRLSPPYARAKLWKKCVIHVDQNIRDVLVETLEREASGMALVASGDGGGDVEAQDWSTYTPFTATYAIRVTDLTRLDDPDARPYCVQYEESDVDFVARILEEEGISYHFEHTVAECVLVLGDADTAFRDLKDRTSLSADKKHLEARAVRAGGRLRPKAIALSDYDPRKPDLDMIAASPAAGKEPGVTMEQPGGYPYKKELGEHLARVREERFDTERRYASLETNCRALSAGALFALEHPKFGGAYLAHRLDVHLRQRESFGETDGEPTYTARVECLFAAASGADELKSKFRPARRTPRPRIAGSQTAVVTAEPGQDQEINVGAEGDFGCVRVRFHWDWDAPRREQEPSSCWIRVSQMFAGGRGHGAMFHPRVGDEVIVDFLEGDPDRPIITGRVYNGRNLSPENATERPTYSCIKSMTSPYDGNYNMMAFDDLQGEEKFIIHVAKDYITNVRNNASRFVMNLDKVEIKGDQETLIHGSQTFEVLGAQSVHVVAGQSNVIDASRTTKVGVLDSLNVGAIIVRKAGASITDTAPVIAIDGNIVDVHGAQVTIRGDGSVTVKAPQVTVDGGQIDVNAKGSVNVKAGGPVNVSAPHVKVNAGMIDLNC